MQQAVTSFLDYLAGEKGYSPNTIAAYRNDLNQFLEYLQHGEEGGYFDDWMKVRKDSIIFYVLHLRERSYASTTVARKMACLKSFFHFLVDEGIIKDDPTTTLTSPKVERQLPRSISREEVAKLLAQPAQLSTAKGLRDKALLELLYATGMRVSELVSLNLEDVDLASGSVRCLGKGSKERLIPIHREATQALEEYLGEGRPKLVRNERERAIFLNLRGGRLTRQGLWLIVKERAQAAGLGAEVTPHTLRHSFAIHVLDGGLNLRQVQELLGHASISTTQVYTHIATDRLREDFEGAHPRAR